VEERAIGTDQAQKFVLSLTPTNTVAYRPVQLGPVVEGKRIIRSGVEAGEKVVVNGLARVRPGMAVAAQEAVAETSNSKPQTLGKIQNPKSQTGNLPRGRETAEAVQSKPADLTPN
jgi:hypothetical protein